jgi:DNA-binding transcriptional ArsR family regulator
MPLDELLAQIDIDQNPSEAHNQMKVLWHGCDGNSDHRISVTGENHRPERGKGYLAAIPAAVCTSQAPCPTNFPKTILDSPTIIHHYLVVSRLDSTFAALANPIRRAIVSKLTLGPASIHDLTEPFSLSQQMISKHVACLVRAQIVVKRRRGRESICALRPDAVKAVADWALDFRRVWEESFDKLDAVLQEMKNEEATHGKSNNK